MRDDNIMDVEEALLGPAEIEPSLLRCVCLLDSELGRAFRTVEDFEQQEVDGYHNAMKYVMGYCDEHKEEVMSAETIARDAHKLFLAITGQPACAWENVHEKFRLKWLFIVKHLFNLLAYDGSEDGSVQSHEEKIREYFRTALEQKGLITKG